VNDLKQLLIEATLAKKDAPILKYYRCEFFSRLIDFPFVKGKVYEGFFFNKELAVKDSRGFWSICDPNTFVELSDYETVLIKIKKEIG
jgi:hypothetical protein